jgi:hypothetical protein
MKHLAPIILFVYNRPQHALQTLNALQNNVLSKDSVLYIFADGIKENASSETIRKINETRKIIKNKKWCKEVFIIEREQNFGLAKSVILGINEIINKHNKAIVLEDDLVTSPYFLKYMNEALEKYEHIDSVACISGYIYPVNNLPDLFFIKGADCWGWATWKRAWDLFETDGQKLLNELIEKKLTKQFDLNDSYPYTKMLQEQISGTNNSWAIRWLASAFLKNKLCLYPGKSLVNNIGTDGSGSHPGETDVYTTIPKNKPVFFTDIKIEENKNALKKISSYFRALDLVGKKPSFYRELLKKIIPETLINVYRKIIQ